MRARNQFMAPLDIHRFKTQFKTLRAEVWSMRTNMAGIDTNKVLDSEVAQLRKKYIGLIIKLLYFHTEVQGFFDKAMDDKTAADLQNFHWPSYSQENYYPHYPVKRSLPENKTLILDEVCDHISNLVYRANVLFKINFLKKEDPHKLRIRYTFDEIKAPSYTDYLNEQIREAIIHQDAYLLRALMHTDAIDVNAKFPELDYPTQGNRSTFFIECVKYFPGHTGVVDYLLERNDIDTNCPDAKGNSPLFYLLLKKSATGRNIKTLIKKGAKVTDLPSQAMNFAFMTGNDVAAVLLNTYTENRHSWTIDVLIGAIQFSDTPHTIKIIYNYIINNYPKNEIQKHLDANHFSELTLMIALENTNAALALIKESPYQYNVIYDYSNDLLLAVRVGNLKVVKALLEHKLMNLNINATDKDFGMTPLMWAVKLGHQEMLEILAPHSNVNHVIKSGENKGKTACHLAAGLNQPKMVKTLLKKHQFYLYTKDETLSPTAVDEIGTRSKASLIANLSICELTQRQIEYKIEHFKENGRAFYGLWGIGNNRKAKKIAEALARANAVDPINVQEFLHYKKDGKQQSILEALDYHRVGFFGHTRSYQEITQFVNEITPKVNNHAS